MDWDKLKIFHAVAEAGSFTNATVNLNEVINVFPKMLKGETSGRYIINLKK